MSRIERGNENYKISYSPELTKNRCCDESDEKLQESPTKMTKFLVGLMEGVNENDEFDENDEKSLSRRK